MKEITEFKNIYLTDIDISSFKSVENEDKGEIYNIATDIKEKGLIRPVIVYKISEQTYALILGIRRFLAMKEIGQETVLAGVIDNPVSRDEATAIALCYTSLETMLSNSDRVSAIKFLIEETKGNLEKISSITGLDESTIKSYLNLKNLDADLNSKFNNDQISIELATVLNLILQGLKGLNIDYDEKNMKKRITERIKLLTNEQLVQIRDVIFSLQK